MAEGIGIIYRQAGHRIEGAAGVGAENAGHAVEPVDEGISSFQIFGPGCVEVIGGQVGGGLAEDLGEGWGAQSCLGKFHNGVEHCLVAGHECADAAAAGAVAFGDGIHHEHVVLRPFEVHGADMRSAVAEVAVGFVGKKVEVVADDEFPEGLHLFAAVEVAGGVIGVADHDGLCAGRDELFEFGDGWKGEPAFYIGGKRFDDNTGGNGEIHCNWRRTARG